MGGRDILIERLKKVFRVLFKESDNSNKKKYIIVIGFIGLIFIVLSNLFSSGDKNGEQIQLKIEDEEKGVQHIADDTALIVNVNEVEKKYEKDLQKMLNNIQGVTDADVMVNLHSTNVNVYEKNKSTGKQMTEETDKSGGERVVEDETEDTEVVLVRQGDREVPLLIQTNKPNVKGVLIIAKGVEDVEVKKAIIESVSRVLDVPTHRISVMPKMEGEN